MSKKDWTVSVYKKDKRYKSGERFVAKYPFSGMDRAAVARELQGLTAQLYPANDGWRFDVQERYVTVKNLMTGKDVEIEADTPYFLDPSKETYWSM